MKRYPLVMLLGVILVVLSGCGWGGRTLAEPGTHPTIATGVTEPRSQEGRPPAVSGTIELWPDATPVPARHVVLCRVTGEPSLAMPSCILGKSAVVSDAAGHFEIDKAEPGKYNIFYESNDGDFAAALDYWGGRTFHRIADESWFKEYWDFVGLKPGWVNLPVVKGMPRERMSDSAFLRTYYHYFLLIEPSPFYVAFDVQKSFDTSDDLAWLSANTIVEIMEGTTAVIVVQVIK